MKSKLGVLSALILSFVIAGSAFAATGTATKNPSPAKNAVVKTAKAKKPKKHRKAKQAKSAKKMKSAASAPKK